MVPSWTLGDISYRGREPMMNKARRGVGVADMYCHIHPNIVRRAIISVC